MTHIDVDELGPVDYLVVGIPGGEGELSGDMASD